MLRHLGMSGPVAHSHVTGCWQKSIDETMERLDSHNLMMGAKQTME